MILTMENEMILEEVTGADILKKLRLFGLTISLSSMGVPGR